LFGPEAFLGFLPFVLDAEGLAGALAVDFCLCWTTTVGASVAGAGVVLGGVVVLVAGAVAVEVVSAGVLVVGAGVVLVVVVGDEGLASELAGPAAGEPLFEAAGVVPCPPAPRASAASGPLSPAAVNPPPATAEIIARAARRRALICCGTRGVWSSSGRPMVCGWRS
jgi:hypothetical protein